MDHITPLTDPGKRFQDIARELIPTLRAHADEADVSGTMSQVSFDAVSPHPCLTFASWLSFAGILGLFIFPNWVLSFVSQINHLL